jgi:hypothetical protein
MRRSRGGLGGPAGTHRDVAEALPLNFSILNRIFAIICGFVKAKKQERWMSG